MISSAYIRRLLFGISLSETTVAKRGFKVTDNDFKFRIEQIGHSFVTGYHAALQDNHPLRLVQTLDDQPQELRGFVYEGAAMGLVISDFFCPWRSSYLQAFLQGPAAPHSYIVHVGVGWALARLPCSIQSLTKHMHPLLRWLVIDGYGFHEGYFHSSQAITAQTYPHAITGYAASAFDQGLGRSLWFVRGGDVQGITEVIQGFPVSRHAALWSGIGLAAAYAGGVTSGTLQNLLNNGIANRVQLAQGAAFAAKARQQAGNPAEHTELACQILCGCSAEMAALQTDLALQDLPVEDPSQPAYEVWRRRIQAGFA